MIRPAKYQDIPAIERLIREQLAVSKYAGRVEIAPKALASTLDGMIAQSGQRGPYGTHVSVAVREGKVVGFICAVLQRIYMVGDKLEATDHWFVVGKGGTIGDTLALVDAYVAWGLAIRSVIEIKLSWTDTVPGAERLAGLATRKGFTKVGEVFEMRCDEQTKVEAA